MSKAVKWNHPTIRKIIEVLGLPKETTKFSLTVEVGSPVRLYVEQYLTLNGMPELCEKQFTLVEGVISETQIIDTRTLHDE